MSFSSSSPERSITVCNSIRHRISFIAEARVFVSVEDKRPVPTYNIDTKRLGVNLNKNGLVADVKCPRCQGDVYAATYFLDNFKLGVAFRCVGYARTAGETAGVPQKVCKRKLGHIEQLAGQEDATVFDGLQAKINALHARRTKPPIFSESLTCPRCARTDVIAEERIGYNLLSTPDSKFMNVGFICPDCGLLSQMNGTRSARGTSRTLEELMQESLDHFHATNRTEEQ